MATSDGRRVNRPYRKASEYLTSKQATYNGPRTITALENENAELREKLTASVRRIENLEVEFEQSREYFATQVDITTDKLNRTTQTLKMLQRSYSELQSINYELEQRVLKVSHLENEKSQMSADIHDLTNKLKEARNSLHKTQQENERLRKDCNLAVQLLECNEGNFKQQKTNQLPRDLQHRVEEYQMDLSQYNEYINPYAADSDSENEAQMTPNKDYRQGTDTVPTELLAKVLQKPETVRLNMEDSDYIRDPELNSVYKGQIAEKKLVKYDYEAPDSSSGQGYSATVPRSSNINNNQRGHYKDNLNLTRSSSGVQSSSPWELAPASSGGESSGSPWEMSSAIPRRDEEDVDDCGAASAYGAYPVSYRRSKQRLGHTRYNTQGENRPKETPASLKAATYTKSKMSASFNRVTSPKVQKGSGENLDVYISQSFQQQHEETEKNKSASDSSNKSSRRTTPAKIPVDVERGTNAEKSSLLDQECSDEDDMVMTVELGARGMPKLIPGSQKSYRGKETGKESRGLLDEDVSDREVDERELDEEVESSVRECEEEGDVRDYEEKVHLREMTKRDIPEFDLLNLDESAFVVNSPQSSPAHQIMMQQTLLLQDLESPVTDLAPTSLLPDLPPPSGFSEAKTDGMLLMGGDLPAPPPPDMFGESLPSPMTRPLQLGQSGVAKSDLQQNIDEVSATSRTTTPLGDLKVFVEKELKSPQKTQTPAVVNETSPETRSETPPSSQNDGIAEPNGVSVDEGGVDVSDENDVPTEMQMESITAADESQLSEDDVNSNYPVAEIETCDAKEIHCDEINKNKRVYITLDNQVLDAENFDDTGDIDDNINDNDVANCDLHRSCNNNSQMTSSGQSSEETAYNEHLADTEPLEVLTLQEEPRGGNHNRRRRNSFDQAREFGSVMDD